MTALTPNTLMRMLEAVDNNDVAWLDGLIADGLAPANESLALRSAVYSGRTNLVQLLLPHSDVFAFHDNAIKMAVENNHGEIFDLLWKEIVPHAANKQLLCYELLQQTIGLGRMDMLLSIVAVADIGKHDGSIFFRTKNPAIIDLLAEHCTQHTANMVFVQSVMDNQPLYWESLVPFIDCEVVSEHIQRVLAKTQGSMEPEYLLQAQERVDVERQRRVLGAQVSGTHEVSRSKSKI